MKKYKGITVFLIVLEIIVFFCAEYVVYLGKRYAAMAGLLIFEGIGILLLWVVYRKAKVSYNAFKKEEAAAHTARETQTKQEERAAEKASVEEVELYDIYGSYDSLCPFSTKDRFKPVNIIDVAAHAVDEMRVAADHSSARINISTAYTELMVYADFMQLKILFKNIIDNSIKYMQRAGSLLITISKVENDVLIVFKDNGFGMSAHELPHIFELNYQGTNKICGNGLGLAQVKAIVNAYDGHVYAKSGENKGMAIYIYLPTNFRAER